MSNSRDYIITTLRNSVRQHGSASLGGTVVANNQVPFSFSPFTARIRNSGVPYVTGPETATDLNLRRNVPKPSGGGGIPESITARDNLQHWWKMNGPSTTEYSDEGLSAESSNVPTSLSLTDATIVSSGPAAIGSPSYVLFNGTSTFGQIAVVDGENADTNINTIFASGDFSISFWFALNDTPSYPSSIFNATSRLGGLSSNNGVGTWYQTYNARWFGYTAQANNGQTGDFGNGSNTFWVTKAESTSTWVNCVMVMDSSGANQLRCYVDGTLSGQRTLNSNDAQVAGNTGGFGSWLILGGSPTNSANSALSVGYFAGRIGMVDFRIYDKALSTDEISDISAGDWT